MCVVDAHAGSAGRAQPPMVICVDPRETPVAQAATVHLAPLPGTNVSLMNGLLHEIIRNDWVDHDYVAAHSVGYQELAAQVDDYPPERVAEICQVPAQQIREAARILGTAQRLLSTVLQGFYQSPQATAAAVQVNNMRYAEQGTIRFLWVSGTNPAVSLPELRRIRSILSQQRLFLVVQDIFPTETTELADVVLPAATWGEKTGTFTNADRTVHLSDKAVEPPGQARPDLDIFLDYARRMDFRDRDGAPLPPWHDAGSAFEAWKQCSAGRPCDYTGLSYAKLRGGSGIQWPCTAEHPDGTERLYRDGRFWAAPDYCESYGRDLITGAPLEPIEYQAMNPTGKAVIKAAEYLLPHETPSDEFPLYPSLAGRCFTSTPGPRPAGCRSCGRRLRTCGWRCRRKTPMRWGSAKGTW
jgi:anaerobic selenocysteine-containing dehydrogenase